MSDSWSYRSSNGNGAGHPGPGHRRPGLNLGDLRTSRNVMSVNSVPNETASRPLTESISAPGMLDTMGFLPQLTRRTHSPVVAGRLQISPDRTFEFTADDLTDRGEIGRGGFGTVNKMFHPSSGTTMAVKRIRSTVEEKEQGRLLMDLDVVMRSSNCPYIVRFFGALFREGDCWICMELMAVSLDRFYKFSHRQLRESIPELILGKIAIATLRALSYLKNNLQIIHRDVKPSNILLDHAGNIKLCDFGISGQLVDSIAKTRDAGCRPYMAPERIDPTNSHRGYDVRSDVWSLGITLVEVATGKFPYPRWESVFDQLTHVVEGPAPLLSADDGSFSTDFVVFVNTCLIKDYMIRPKFDKLLHMTFIINNEQRNADVAAYVAQVLEHMPADLTYLDAD